MKVNKNCEEVKLGLTYILSYYTGNLSLIYNLQMTVYNTFCEMFQSPNFFLNFVIFIDNGLGIEWISELKYTKLILMLIFCTKVKSLSKFQDSTNMLFCN